MALVDITPAGFDVGLDLRYATADNLTGRPIYRAPVCLLHVDAAARLMLAVDLARGQGLRLVIFDAFRPVEAQWRLWEALPDPRYIADPREGSSHSRGIAVDLTLADAEGRALDLGTPFDDMTEQSHHGRLDIPAETQRHRAILLGIMAAAGWQHYSYEWWHYQLPDGRRYPLLSDGAAGALMM